MNNYYKDMDLKYVEKAIALEEFLITNPGIIKFYIPALMPFIPQGSPNDSGVRVSKTHLVNKNKGEISASSGCKESNYIEIELPDYVTAVIKDIEVISECSGPTCSIPEYDIPEGGGTAGGDDIHCDPGNITNTIIKYYFLPEVDEIVPPFQEFIVAFIGGDYSIKKIIGRYVQV